MAPPLELLAQEDDTVVDNFGYEDTVVDDNEEADKVEHQRQASISEAFRTSLAQVKDSRKYRLNKILIVDDDMFNWEVIKSLLKENLGSPEYLKILTAGNGKKAVEICKEEMPELIFMDINMPIMGGYEATKLIKQLG